MWVRIYSKELDLGSKEIPYFPIGSFAEKLHKIVLTVASLKNTSFCVYITVKDSNEGNVVHYIKNFKHEAKNEEGTFKFKPFEIINIQNEEEDKEDIQ